jgi:hypothetical protein
MEISQSAQNRLFRWEVRTDPQKIKDITTANKATYKAHAETAFALLEAMETNVKQVLNQLGLPITDTVGYLAFARTIWKDTQKYHGETLAIEAQVQIDKWTARGLVTSALEAIRSQVFDIPAPIAV